MGTIEAVLLIVAVALAAATFALLRKVRQLKGRLCTMVGVAREQSVAIERLSVERFGFGPTEHAIRAAATRKN